MLTFIWCFNTGVENERIAAQDMNCKLVGYINAEAFAGDPLRMLRAARFAARLGML